MKHLKNNPLKGNHLITAGSLFITILIAGGFLFTGCKKDKPYSNEIIVEWGNSIQDAVDAAKNGTVIIIEPGVYREAITVNKKNITLIGLTRGKYESVII